MKIETEVNYECELTSIWFRIKLSTLAEYLKQSFYYSKNKIK